MYKYSIRECRQCHETKKFYGASDICAACRWWSKHHPGEKRIGAIRVRDNFKSSHSVEYSIYRGMLNRCSNKNNKKYPIYGGRGIKVCERWSGPYGFHRFYEDMGVRPKNKSIDRIDVNGNYCPENCRWADSWTQTDNRRIKRKYSKQVGVTYNKSLGLWCATLNVHKRHYVKYTKTERDAILARKKFEELYLIDIDH